MKPVVGTEGVGKSVAFRKTQGSRLAQDIVEPTDEFTVVLAAVGEEPVTRWLAHPGTALHGGGEEQPQGGSTRPGTAQEFLDLIDHQDRRSPGPMTGEEDPIEKRGDFGVGEGEGGRRSGQ
jgi:hypothetical protein